MKLVYILLFITSMILISGCKNKTKEIAITQAQEDQSDKIIIDDAYVLFDDKKLMRQYKEFNDYLLKKYDIDFRVITISNQEEINLYTNKAFVKFQQESRSKSGRALLLVINTLQDKVRLEVSQALEPIYTDAFVSYIERKGFVPYFRDYKIADGVYMATELVKDRAIEASKGKEWMAPMESKSIGGGAKTKSYIGITDPDAKKGSNVVAMNTDKPKAVLQKYIKALKAHNKNPNLDIYTDTTKEFFANWTVTEINQDHEVENISKCLNLHETLYDMHNTHAVLTVRPYNKHRTCSPYFFKKEEGKWKLDIATMAQILRFNVDMLWHFDMEKRLKKEGKYYAFAFDGYGFDKNGYPYIPKKHYPDWKKFRWQYSCNGYIHPKERKEDAKCWIEYAVPGGPARVRLGLEQMDKIYGIGDGLERKENVTIEEFINYLNSVPSGEIATVIIEHYYLNGKETYKFNDILNPNVKVRYETKQGIAP